VLLVRLGPQQLDDPGACDSPCTRSREHGEEGEAPRLRRGPENRTALPDYDQAA
jgi:hypothetical protein